jgi:hypothetical protein
VSTPLQENPDDQQEHDPAFRRGEAFFVPGGTDITSLGNWRTWLAQQA